MSLDPDGHRVPDIDAVRRHFEHLLAASGESGVVVLIAEVAGVVAGMSELVILSGNRQTIGFSCRAAALKCTRWCSSSPAAVDRG